MSLVDVVAAALREAGECQVPIVVYGANEEQQALFRELERRAEGKITVRFEQLNPLLGVSRGPVILAGPMQEVRWTGMPSGLEEQTFANALGLLCNREHGLPKRFVEELRDLDRRVLIEVFVTSMCPYCPLAAELAIRFAVAARGKVQAGPMAESQNLGNRRDLF